MAQGKPTVFANRSVCYAMDVFSKNTLIDFVIDLAVASLGEDQATDENILNWVQDKIHPTLNYRGGKSPNLVSRFKSYQEHSRKYLQQQEKGLPTR